MQGAVEEEAWHGSASGGGRSEGASGRSGGASDRGGGASETSGTSSLRTSTTAVSPEEMAQYRILGARPKIRSDDQQGGAVSSSAGHGQNSNRNEMQPAKRERTGRRMGMGRSMGQSTKDTNRPGSTKEE